MIFFFGEIHPDSLCRPMFGINMDAQTIHHFLGNYPGQVSNFAFVDGHTGAHRWQGPQFNNPSPPPTDWHNHTQINSKPGNALDLTWLKSHTTVRQ
jgi:prepilin-type processing-associated H-X9-DG protein